MPTIAATFFQAQIDGLLANDLDRIMTGYVLPCPIYFDQGLVTLTGPEELRIYLQGMRQILLARGHSRITATVTRAERPVNGRFRVWVRFSDAAGGELGESADSTYYCLKEKGGLRIAMASHGCKAEADLAARLGPNLIHA